MGAKRMEVKTPVLTALHDSTREYDRPWGRGFQNLALYTAIQGNARKILREAA